jgi:hypothetical protein
MFETRMRLGLILVWSFAFGILVSCQDNQDNAQNLGDVASASALNEPKGFRGVPWNSSEQTLERSFPGIHCVDAFDLIQGHRLCKAEIAIGTIPADARFFFRDNKFVCVELLFKRDEFSEMTFIFQEKYGKPSSSDTRLVRWAGAVLNIVLERDAARGPGFPDSSCATFVLNSEVRKNLEIREKQNRKAADDL